MAELLAPCGNLEKLKSALHFGADAVYIGGKDFSLRAFSENFDIQQMQAAAECVHSHGKKIYAAVNILAYNDDIDTIGQYAIQLQQAGIDAVIVSDIGVLRTVKKHAPNLDIHISTQANVTNYEAAAHYAEMGAKRIVLARELNLKQIKEISNKLPKLELEAFVHGAMCISYSGRCLLSNYFTDRPSNRGQCVQACRWNYQLSAIDENGAKVDIQEDQRGTYILNSKDLNMCAHLDKLIDAGVTSFKIEGRNKSQFYVAVCVNAYRRALDAILSGSSIDMTAELQKASNRGYTTGFYLDQTMRESMDSGKQHCTSVFIANVLGYDRQKRAVIVEQRNRFFKGDTLEILSPDDNFNKPFKVQQMHDQNGNEVVDAKLVQQILYLKSDMELNAGDILRSVQQPVAEQ